jgi:hypothetical protein
MSINNIEGMFTSGAIPITRLNRAIRRLFRKKLGKGFGVDWSVEYDSRTAPIGIKNQGINYSCGGESASYLIEIHRKSQGIMEGAISAKSIYAPIAYPGGGTTVSALVTQICFHGANLEATVPSYDANGQPLSEAMMIEKSWQTDATRADALTRAGYTEYDVGTDIDDVASAIQAYGPVIIEIEGQNGHIPGWLSATPQPPSKTNPNPTFNHFLCGFGFKTINGVRYISVLESMGEAVGENGVQYISEDYFRSGYVLDVVSFIYDTQIIPLPSNQSILANIVRWFKEQWALANSLT